MRKVISFLLALVMALSLCGSVWGNEQGGNGPSLPEGTRPLCFKGTDKNGEEHYYNGTGIRQGESVTFPEIYKNDENHTQITDFHVNDDDNRYGLTAAKNGSALTVTAAQDCEPGEKFVYVVGDDTTKYALLVHVEEKQAGGPPAYDCQYQLSANTAVGIRVPSYLKDVVRLSWDDKNNTLTVAFREDLTAADWKNIFEGGEKRDFAMLSYTFLYIGGGSQPNYWTWVDNSDKATDDVIAEAQGKQQYKNDRGISNAICVAKFQQNEDKMLALPGNTGYNSTSREIISWEGKTCDYFTNVIDTAGMSAVTFALGYDPFEDYGKGNNWLTRLGTAVETPRIKANTSADGVMFTVDNGLVKTFFDNTKPLELQKVLESYVTVTPPADATEYRMVGNSTSTEPGAADDAGAAWEVSEMKTWLGDKAWQPVSGAIRVAPKTLEKKTVDSVSYYIGATITGVHCNVFEWKFADGTTKVEYVYFNADSYVYTVKTDSVTAVTSAVEKPTLQSSDATLRLTCRIFPQNNEDASYMRLTVEKNGQTVSEFSGNYTVYIPYDYMGLTWAEAQKLTTVPRIYHYNDDDTRRETLVGEYTEYGVKFTTKSFSPFVVDCSAASGGSGSSGSSGSSGITHIRSNSNSSPATGDAGLLPYAAMALTGCTGAALTLRRKRRED